jgi:2-polyprenyl-3-methyl-5-hydroxy-6-metoxy-1,4-benzoquinol methylase
MRSTGTNMAPGAPAPVIIDSQAVWDETADWWSKHLKEDKNRHAEVFPTTSRLLGHVSDLEVLDAGCGEGSFTRQLADQGARVTGIDFCRLLDFAQNEELSSPRGIRYIKADLLTLPKLGATFDRIVCNMVLHCLPSSEPLFAVFSDVLKPNGKLVISDLHPATFSHYSQAWTSCKHVENNQYLFTLSGTCPEIPLYLHTVESLRVGFQKHGFRCAQMFEPPARDGRFIPPGDPHFIYIELQKL